LRPFRHTCTAASATMGFAIISLLKEESEEKIVFERQIKTEQKNKTKNKKRIEKLKEQVKEIKNKIN
jgi:Holliday junction resolvasome RuvABC endonuclease subunit